MSAILLANLYAIRASVEGGILQLEHEMRPVEVEPPADGCPHPDGKQHDATTLGGSPTILCLACGDERPGVLQQ